MSSNSPISNSFFKTLRNGISTINKNVMDVEEKMKVSVVDLPEDNTLMKLVHVSDEIKEMILSARQMSQELEKSNKEHVPYYKAMESIVKDIEGKVGNLINHLKEFGYTPTPTVSVSESPPSDESLTTPQNLPPAYNGALHKSSDTDKEDTSNNCTDNVNFEHMMEKTPTLTSSATLRHFIRKNTLHSKDSTLFGSVKHLEDTTVESECTATTTTSITTAITPEILGTAISERVKVTNRYTPDEPLLTSLRKKKELVDDVATPEDVTVVPYSQDCIPSTPKTPQLRSVHNF